MRWIRPPLLTETKPDLNHWISLSQVCLHPHLLYRAILCNCKATFDLKFFGHSKLPCIPIHFLWTHLMHSTHLMEWHPTLFPHTAQGSTLDAETVFCPEGKSFVLLTFIFKPLWFSAFLHIPYLPSTSDQPSPSSTKSSAYKNSFRIPSPTTLISSFNATANKRGLRISKTPN